MADGREIGAPTRYPGPLALDAARSALMLQPIGQAEWRPDGARQTFLARDLGIAEASGGRVFMRHTRAVKPFEAETGWHWHDMDTHVVFVLRGWLRFRFDGVPDPVTVEAGGVLSQPAGVPHNVIGHSDDLELIEISLPAGTGAMDLPQGPGR
jgi:uncharacterized RmlC-like cupin family protein